MSERGRTSLSSRSRFLLALAGATALGMVPALAQLAPIRSPITDTALRRTPILEPTPAERPTRFEALDTAAPVPEYRPETPTAAEDAEARAEAQAAPNASIFEDADGEADVFADPIARAQGTRPVSVRQRAEQARQSRTAPPRTAAERIAAEDEARRGGASAARPTEVSAETTGTIDDLGLDRGVAVEPSGIRAEPVEIQPVDPEENPYAPLGIRVGTFGVTATLDQLLGHSTNPDFTPDGDGATISETALRLSAVSDWSRHSARIDAYGTYRKSLSGEEVDDQEAGLDAAFDFDLGGYYSANAALGWSIRPESASSPVDIVGAASRPNRQTFTGSAGVAKDEGALRLALTGDLERSTYGDADLSTGGTLSQEDRDYTLATATLRAGYAVSPALVPFVEAEYGRRIYDLDIDASGYERSANRMGLRGGVEVDLGEKVTGEIAAGWLRETIDDDRLDAISAATLDANIAWSPVRGTTVSLLGSTTVEGTTTVAESGSVLYSGTLLVSRDLRADLTATASVGAYLRDYAGTNGEDRGFVAEAGATWWLNRTLGFTGRARYETLTSTLPGRDADVASVFAGLRLQR